jgi:ABC-2 type transport system ATP-binding protein
MSHQSDAPTSHEPADPEDPSPVTNGDGVAPLGRPASEVIRVERLCKVYRTGSREHRRDVVAVDGLDLTVCKGEIFGLLGPNGAGKTTTVGMLTTRIVPTSGHAEVNGVDVVADPAQAKHYIGVVQQQNTLDRSLTVWENLYFHGRYYGIGPRASRDQADALLERFRLSHRADAPVRALSGGMAQRLMVARAVFHRPAVLFLDEPTAGLDPQSRLALWEIVGGLRAEGQTILLTTHYMEEAEEFCDRVAIMDHGHILALDTPAALKHAASGPESTVGSAKAWLAQLRALDRLDESTPSNGEIVDRTGVEAALLELISVAERHGLSLDDLKGEVNLETVFINLTGRDLRE